MRKPISEKTPLAAWATLSRDEAGMSVEEVVDALAERGHSVTAATIRGIEGGSKGASARLRRLLAETYGVKPPGEDRTIAPSDTAIVEAIDRLRVSIEDRLDGLSGALVQGLTPAILDLLAQLVVGRAGSEDVPERQRVARE